MAPDKYQPLTLTPINFSLTEGTSIPAPLDSPPESPHPPTTGKGPLSSHPTPRSDVFPQHRDSPPPKDSTDDAPLHQTTTNDGNASTLSPASPTSKRPSSSERPGSPATVSSQPSLSRKKSSSWFGRRKSTFIGSVPEGKENLMPQSNGQASAKPAPVVAAPPRHKGPPPPALPELKSFGVSEDAYSLGADDMFKNIK